MDRQTGCVQLVNNRKGQVDRNPLKDKKIFVKTSFEKIKIYFANILRSLNYYYY